MRGRWKFVCTTLTLIVRPTPEEFMAEPQRIKGVLAPVVTPIRPDYGPDAERLIRHCSWIVAQDCGLAVFGTNSEANSFSVSERMAVLEALVASGVDPARMIPGTGCCALSDSIQLTEQAVKLGCAGALMLPPFYYKDVSDEGLYRFFSETIQRIGDERLRTYLYHIPSVSQVPITLPLIERLIKAYPNTVVGMKDSSGDWTHIKAVLDAFGKSGFDVFAGTEALLLPSMRHGGAGCISATANINPAAIHKLYVEWRSADADAQQRALNRLRNTVADYPMIPALKLVVAHYSGDPAWARLRPPLVELTPGQAKNLVADLAALAFTMPGLQRDLTL
jgi:4-hydroxy-tetrahydrodipicolinate synthase